MFFSILGVDALQFPGSLGASGIGKAGPARVEVAPAEEAEEPVLIFPVHGLLEVYKREAEAGEEGEECVSLGGRLKEALLVFVATAAIWFLLEY